MGLEIVPRRGKPFVLGRNLLDESEDDDGANASLARGERPEAREVRVQERRGHGSLDTLLCRGALWRLQRRHARVLRRRQHHLEITTITIFAAVGVLSCPLFYRTPPGQCLFETPKRRAELRAAPLILLDAIAARRPLFNFRVVRSESSSVQVR